MGNKTPPESFYDINTTVHRLQEVISMVSTVQSTQQWLLTGGPPQISSKQDSVEWNKNMKWVPV